MTKLKLGPLWDDKPVKISVELPAQVHRDLAEYAAAVGYDSNNPRLDPAKLIAPIVARFIATDREFKKRRRGAQSLKAAAPGLEGVGEPDSRSAATKQH